MRVRDSSGRALPAGAARAGEAGGAARPAPARPGEPARRPLDVATIMGIAEAQITPDMRAAIGRLMAEVQSLRQELIQAHKRIEYLERLADRDPLAPVLNRRAFVRELGRMIAFAERYGAPGSVLYFDIDDMKRINDAFGHGAGDRALTHVAEALLREVRAFDVVGRLGGDEFGVVLAQADARAAAAKAAALARVITAKPATWRGETLGLGVSYGVYTFAGGERVDEALEAADHAMYARKRAVAGASG